VRRVGEELARAIAKKFNIPEEDAKLALAVIGSLDEGSQLEKVLGVTAGVADALSKASPQVQQATAPLVQAALAKQLLTDPLQRQLATMVSGLATVKYLFGSDPQINVLAQTIGEQIKALSEKLAKIEESKTREEFQKFVDGIAQQIELINQQIATLSKRIEGGNGGSEVDSITSAVNTIRSFREALKELGYKVVGPGEAASVEDVYRYKDYLEKLGYEVRPRAITPEEVNRMIRERDEMWKKRMDRYIKKVAKVKEAEARKTEALAAILTEILATARAYLSKGAGGEGLADAIVRKVASYGTQQTQQAPQAQG
jgi:transcription termination factor NusB